MNNYSFPFFPTNDLNYIINELKKIQDGLNIINKKIDNINKENADKYLKKDDNYYMI